MVRDGVVLEFGGFSWLLVISKAVSRWVGRWDGKRRGQIPIVAGLTDHLPVSTSSVSADFWNVIRFSL